MDRLFLDANVLFSMAYGGVSLEVFWNMSKKGRCKLLASNYVIKEAMHNLSLPNQSKRLKQLLAEVEIVPEADPKTPCPLALPAKYRSVFLAAWQARATHLLTGDLRHFNTYQGESIQGVFICKPRHYLQSLLSSNSSGF